MSAGAVVAALGGRKVLKTEINSEFDWTSIVKEGIPAEAAYSLLNSGLLEADELYDLVIPRRTIERRREEKQHLTSTESDKLLRIVRVIVQAIEALASSEKARKWLRTPNRALRGEEPLSLLETDVGARMVERVLGRIEYGVYS
jgi:putative toxin-antitoxin system antitoxin component (TIGR02293 family)